MTRKRHDDVQKREKKKKHQEGKEDEKVKTVYYGYCFSHTSPFGMVLPAYRLFYSALHVSRYRYRELERSNVVQLDVSTRIILRFLYENYKPGKKNTHFFRVITLKNRCNHFSDVHAYISDCHIMARPIRYRQTIHDTPYRYDSRRNNFGDYVHQRTWCYICPIGTISNWVGKNRQPLYAKDDLCTNCKLCGRPCPMNLAPHELKDNGNMSFRGIA